MKRRFLDTKKTKDQGLGNLALKINKKLYSIKLASLRQIEFLTFFYSIFQTHFLRGRKESFDYRLIKSKIIIRKSEIYNRKSLSLGINTKFKIDDDSGQRQ